MLKFLTTTMDLPKLVVQKLKKGKILYLILIGKAQGKLEIKIKI